MATAIDWSQGVDFSPLEKLGVDRAGAIKLLTAVSGLINLEFQAKIKSAFSPEELKAVGEEAKAKGIKPENGLELIEAKYHTKTGNYFLEEMRQLYNRWIIKLAEILLKVRRQAAAIGRAEAGKQQQLEQLIEELAKEKNE